MARPKWLSESAWDSEPEDRQTGCPRPTPPAGVSSGAGSRCANHFPGLLSGRRDYFGSCRLWSRFKQTTLRGTENHRPPFLGFPILLSPYTQLVLLCPRGGWLRRPLSNPWAAQSPVVWSPGQTSLHTTVATLWAQVTQPPLPPRHLKSATHCSSNLLSSCSPWCLACSRNALRGRYTSTKMSVY